MSLKAWILQPKTKGEHLDLYALIDQIQPKELEDYVLGKEDLTLVFHENIIHLSALQSLIATWSRNAISTKEIQPRTIDLHIDFEKGLDWEHVCQVSKLTREVYLQKLLNSSLEVAMIGFLPGFIYLKGMDPSLKVPRKDKPSMTVPAGSFAIGDDMAGMYHFSSPGGWHVIGQSTHSFFDFDNLPRVGDRIIIHPYQPK
jgi:KipI family sensor histidine kinase inhibitor